MPNACPRRTHCRQSVLAGETPRSGRATEGARTPPGSQLTLLRGILATEPAEMCTLAYRTQLTMAFRRARRYRLLWLIVIVLAIIGLAFSILHTNTPSWHCKACSSKTSAEPSEEPSEEPRRHVYFLKTHKCASTTIQRILLSYALRHSLAIALPMAGENVFYPQAFRPEIAKRTRSYPHFDIMASHTRFHHSARQYMPNDTLFLSVVRDPAEQMESAYHYFYFHECKALKRPTISFAEYLDGLLHRQPGNGSLEIDLPCVAADLRFLQMHDFGLTLNATPSADIIARKIREIEEAFHLVLVVEKIDEGLILMRDILKWSTADLLYLKNNYRPRTDRGLANETRLKAYAWNWADKMLYDHFKAKMDSMIKLQEDYIESEVREFRRLREIFYEYCVRADHDTASRTVTPNKNDVIIDSYLLNDKGGQNYSCQLAAMSELQLFTHINSIQPELYTTASPSRDATSAAAAANTGSQKSGTVWAPVPYS